MGSPSALRELCTAALLGSAAVHAAVVPEHLEHWTAAGLSFAVLAATQAVVGVLLLLGYGTKAVRAALVVGLLPLPVWLLSRTAGLPFGPGASVAEPVGWADGAAALLAIATVLLASALLRPRTGAARGSGAGRPGGWRGWGTAGLAAVAVVTGVGLTGATQPHPGGEHDGPDHGGQVQEHGHRTDGA